MLVRVPVHGMQGPLKKKKVPSGREGDVQKIQDRDHLRMFE
jgi:hypothetical protein